MTGTLELLDTTDSAKVREYETAFYHAFARVTSNRLVHQLWAWDYANMRLATRIPYPDQLVCVWRKADGALHTAIAFNTAMREFQSAYFGFQPPHDMSGCFEVLTFFSTGPQSIAWLTAIWRECLNFLTSLNLSRGYATTARRPVRLYRIGGWRVVEQKEIEGDLRCSHRQLWHVAARRTSWSRLRKFANRGHRIQYILNTAPLAGIRIVDFSHALAGPYCTLILSDFGADVYKLESPGSGDMGRGWGPPFAGTDSSFFVGLNRGKSGISIDLKRPEGIDLCMCLIDKMDVLVENFRPGTMSRLGLGYEAVAARNPRVVYCSISGYGQNGPSRDEAAMDVIVESSSGFMSITGTEAGEQVRSGYAVCDINAGLFAVIGIMMALRAREQTGRGQYIDVAMLDCMISAMSSNYMTFLGSGVVPGPLGSAFQTVVPYQVFQASDRGFSIAVGSEKLWAAFCGAIGRRDLQSHPDFATNAARVANRKALERILAEVFRARPMTEWIERLRAVGIPCSPVRTFDEVLHDPQTAVREMFPSIDVAGHGRHRVTGPAVKLHETPAAVRAPQPALGQHTRPLLADLLDLEEAAIRALEAAGVIYTVSGVQDGASLAGNDSSLA